MKKISHSILCAVMASVPMGLVYAESESLPIIHPNLDIEMPDAVFSDTGGSVLRLKADFDFVGMSERGTFLWEVKPDGYDITEVTTNVPAEVLDCSSSRGVPEGETHTLINKNNGVDYIINCIYSVEGDLTINPGVTIQFGTDAGIRVEDSGSIQVLGASDQPVVLTGEDKIKGSWRGLYIDSNDAKNTVQYTQIDYAGGKAFNSNDDLGAVIVWADARLNMHNTTISHSASYGFNANYGNTVLTLIDNVIRSSKAPMLVKTDYVTNISGGDYAENELSAITVVGNGVSTGITGQHNWKNLGVNYRIAKQITVEEGGQLTIQPGVTLEFEDDGKIYVNESVSGRSAPSLVAIGTESKPIIFTAVNKVVGAWQGIYFDTPSPLNEISFATIAYASNPNQEGAISTWADTVLNVNNVRLENIQGCGFKNYKSAVVTMSNIINSNVTTELCEF